MAYVASKQLPDDQENQFGRTDPTTPVPSSAPVEAGGSAGSGTGGGAAPGVGTPTQFGSNAAKLSDYLKANEAQVGEFGQQVAGNLKKGYEDTLGAINQGSQQFGQQVSQGYAQPNQDLVNQATSNPTEFVRNPQNVSSFQSLYNNQYGGPTDFESSDIYGNLNNQVNRATENAGLVNSFGGLQSFLNNNMGGSNRTQGMQTLDTALLQRSPEAANAIRSAAQPYSNLSSYLGQATQGANQGIEQARNTANQSRDSLRNQFTGEGGIIPSFQTDLQGRVQGARQSASERAQNVRNIMNGLGEEGARHFGNNETTTSDLGATRQQLVRLGAIQDAMRNQYLNLRDPQGNPFMTEDQLSLDPYLNYRNPEAEISNENVASADDFARFNALRQLTGDSNMNFLNPELANQAGTANQDMVDFNIQNALNERNNLLNSQDNSLFQMQMDSLGFGGSIPEWMQQQQGTLNGLALGNLEPTPWDRSTMVAAQRQGYWTPPEGSNIPVLNPLPPETIPALNPQPFIPPALNPSGGGQPTPTDTAGLPPPEEEPQQFMMRNGVRNNLMGLRQ